MKLQTVMIAAVALLMAGAIFEAQASQPNCANANVQCKTVAGPATVDVKDVVSVGVGLCQVALPQAPLFCDLTTGNGISAAGAATFDDSSFAGTTGESVSIWIRYNQDVLPCTADLLVCGFYATVCNDRDLSSDCTNVGAQFDQLWDLYSDTSLTPGCPDKDQKDCGDPNSAGASDLCFYPATDGNWYNNQTVVFVGVWAGVVATDNVGAGVSVGTYDIYQTDNGSDNGCTDSVGTTDSTGCIWEADAVSATLVNLFATDFDSDLTGADGDSPVDGVNDVVESVQAAGSDFCRDTNPDGSPGAVSSFSCVGATAVVVFVVGVGSSTETGCTTPSLTAAFPGVPVAADTPTGATFTCAYTWTAVAVGGCITV